MENIDELMKAFFEKPEYLILLSALNKVKKVKRRLRSKQKTILIEKGEFYCPYCLRKTNLTLMPFKADMKTRVTMSVPGSSGRGILVCNKCFTFLGIFP